MIIIKPLIQVKGKQYRNKKLGTVNLGETVQDVLNIDEADSGSENSRNEKLPVGLKNIGNTCYMYVFISIVSKMLFRQVANLTVLLIIISNNNNN